MDIIFSDYLWKRSPVSNSFLKFNNWKKRYFVIDYSGKLDYYVDNTKKELKGTYYLDGETQIGLLEEMETYKNIIRIVTTKREIFISAENNNIKQKLYSLLNQWCDMNRIESRITHVLEIRNTMARNNSNNNINNNNNRVDRESTVTSLNTYNIDINTPSTVEVTPSAVQWDQSRREMYSYVDIPREFVQARESLEELRPNLHFSDHAFGAVPPRALYRAQLRSFAYHTGLVNGLWAALWGEDIPAACARVKEFLGFNKDSNDIYVEVAHNIHQIIGNLFSSRFDRVVQETCNRPFRVLTSDVEFYSVTRQLNRFIDTKSPRFIVECITAYPIETFSERTINYLKEHSNIKYDFIYLSQVSFIQMTLIPYLNIFVKSCRDILDNRGNEDAIIVIDGYHSFAAFNVNLVNCDCIFVFGVLKHMGCGTNLAFACVPKKYCSLRPLITGWLADFSVLSPTHTGIKLGSPVDYQPGVVLMGSTVAIGTAILTFNNVIDEWKQRNITPSSAHEHIMSLHRQLLNGLDELELKKLSNPFICRKRLLILQPEEYRSHTLVFVQENPMCAMLTVNYFALHRITLDSRNTYVRFGIGLNHNYEDIIRVLDVLSKWNLDIQNDTDNNKSSSRIASVTYN